MSTLVIKNVPEDLHDRLRQQAERNRRSVTQETLVLIERGLGSHRRTIDLPPPIKLKGGPLTAEELEKWRNEGRD
jgi:plasmid stability protein